MDACEATNILISKIKKIDPENASKIMGYILLQALSDTDLASLASSHESLLRNVVLSAKSHLGITSSSLSAPSSNPSSPSPLNPISRPRNPFSRTSPRVTGNGPFVDFARNPSALSWPLPGLLSSGSDASSMSPKFATFLSYDNIRSGPMLVPPRMRNGSFGGDSSTNGGDLLDEYQLDEYFSFMDDSSARSEEPVDPSGQLGGFLMDNGNARFHRRSFSESGACLGVEDGGFGVGYKPCMYYARGFCKNGDSCKFVHCGFGGDDVFEGVGGSLVGSPREMDGLYLQQEDFIRMKPAPQKQHQRLTYDKYMNFLLQQRDDPHRLGGAAEILGDEFHKFTRFRAERNDLLNMSMADMSNSAARQIYLTFPADSTFRDEDVSNYFSTFGPVQDVRIPYQQKRMFGFVTFVHPETVKLILAQGNPHFICNSRVLVKPYKEKGKLVSERQQHLQQQLLERGNFSPCSSPSAFDSRELFDLHAEARMLQDAQEMMLRRKLEEQAELQQAIELQGRRMFNLQLPDLRQEYARYPHRSLSVGTPIPVQAQTFMSQNIISNSSFKNHDISNDNSTISVGTTTATAANCSDPDLQPEVTANCNLKSGAVEGTAESYDPEGSDDAHDCHDSNREHSLPENLFGSPKSAGKQHTELSPASLEV